MSKKQLSNYKFYPGVIPPAYNQFPATVNLITANKDYIIAEATEYLSWRFNTPETPIAYLDSAENDADLLLANKEFIKEEANAWVLSQIENDVAPFVGYSYDATKQAKCKRDIGYLIDAFALDLVGGGTAETIRITRMFFLGGVDQLLNPVQEAAVHEFVKDLIAVNVLPRVLYTTEQDPIVAAQDLGVSIPVSSSGDLALSIAKLNELNDIVINAILDSDGLNTLTDISFNYDATFANLIYNEGYTSYDEAKCIRDVEYVVDAFLYDLTYGGNSLTYYVASQYQVLGVYTVRQPEEVESSVQTFVKSLILDYILDNIYHPSYQLDETQTVTATVGSPAGQTQLGVLADIVIDVLDIGSSTLPEPVAPDRQGGNLLPNAVSLIERNKRYIQEESIAFIQFSVDNNLFPFVFFTYNATKCRRDVSYILEGYLKDLKNGGNLQTNFNAAKYWEGGIAQVDGDRQPEIYTHRFIRDLIENFILTNVAFDSRQILVNQVIDNSIITEIFAYTRIRELSNTILQVIEFGLDFLPREVSNRGFIKVPGYFKLKDFLLITNNSRNQIMFNFADDTLGAQVTYSEEVDPDFNGALFGVDKISKLVFDVDTSGMMITDDIQIFVEGKEQAVRLNQIATDAMERMKVGIPQSMLDADFEYGLQPTKWQAIALMRNYPSIYEIPGSDAAVINVVTDASVGTAGSGASLITVTTQSAHGFEVGDPLTIKALANTVSGFSRAEGSFLVASTPSDTTFTYYAKSKVGTTNGQVLASSATQLRAGGFYTGSSIGNPTFSVFSSGSSGSVTTSLVTPSGRSVIGFTGSPPPLGAPLSGTGIASGTQVTSVVGSGGVAASTSLTVAAAIGATDIIVNSTTGLSSGLLFDRGDGVGVTITNIVGNTVTLGGALTSAIVGSSASYSTQTGVTNGDGIGAVFTVARSGGTYSATITSTGSSYTAGNTIVIAGTNLDGASPANDATITVVSASSRNSVATFDNGSLLGGTGYVIATGVATSGGTGTGLVVNVTASAGVITVVSVNAGGQNYTAGDLITITNPNPLGAVLAYSQTFPVGTLYVSANNQPTTVSPSGGTGLTVDITASAGAITAITINNRGSGYAVNDVVTVISGSTRGGATVVDIATAGDGYAEEEGAGVLTTGGSGTGLTVDIVVSPAGEVAALTIQNAGNGDGLEPYTSATGLNASGFGETSDGIGLTVDIIADEDPGSPTFGEIISVSINTPGEGFLVDDVVSVIQGSNASADLLITSVFGGRVTGVTINAPGSGYQVNDIVTIAGTFTTAATLEIGAVSTYDGTFVVSQIATNGTIEVLTVNPGGAIQSISTTGTPITAPTKDFISAFTISEVTTAQIASGNTGISFSAIATLQINFTTPHGLVPGDTITVDIRSTGTGAQLAAGPYFVEAVPTPLAIRYTARAAGTINNTLIGSVYGRPDSFFIHRPFDGGVQLGTASPSHGAGALRMSKKYIRYQSGKGVMYNTGALFAPSYDIRAATSTGTAVGSIITITTDDTDHGCQVGGVITIQGVLTSGYDGIYTVAGIVNERVLTVVATRVLESTTGDIGSPCVMSIRNWHGSTIRAGIYDDQNGMFWQYDGIRMAVVRRSSTFQIAGTIAINANENTVVGTNTRFRSQLAAGDKVVIRGMTHIITSVSSNTALTVAPDFRGVVNVTDTKMSKIQDLEIPQEDWNYDTLNGAGPSGYNLDVTKMQMISIQHTWYGAGFIDYMLRGSDGNYCFAHRIRNSNVNTEAYMRTGNQPVRYEVTNEGARSKLSADIDSIQTTLPLEETFWFPSAGTVYIDNEMISYTGRTATELTGCTRAAALTQFTAGSQRSFTAGEAEAHDRFTGVVLISNTITPNISHWGSAFMIDGQFDSDRGYIFNYAATGVPATLDKTTAFLIRLAPSVSNAIVGDLGEKELLNRAQLLLSGISVTSDDGTGAIVVEGVLNPINYPTDPTKITWQGLGTQAAGGQPSFAQIASGGSVTWDAALTTSTATVQGAFTTTITANSFAAATQNITAVSFTAGSLTANITATSFSSDSAFGLVGMRRAIENDRSYIVIPTSELDALTTSITTTAGLGDVLSDPTFNFYITSGQRITGVVRDIGTRGGISYSRINLSANPNQDSDRQGIFEADGSDNVTIRITFSLPGIYQNAVSNARSDFLITQTQFASSTIALADILSAATHITGGQTISTLTANYVNINGVAYARVIMSAVGNSSSTAGSGNNVTVTVTSAATALYASALSTGRQDFLITNTQFDASGILVGDTLSLATFITGGQTIQQIVRNFITIGGTAFTRIVMSANANSTSTAGSGNNQTVTVTALGSAASYTGNFLFVTSASYATSGISVNTRVATTDTKFPAGTAVQAISSRTFGATTVFRITFNQSAATTIAAAAEVTFQFGAEYALPGETVFSFISNPGETATLDLNDLKELTASTIGGRGAFPNGPDVLAINIYKISGATVPTSVILRWGEAQA